MTGRARQVHLVEYPVGEVTPDHFVTVDVDVPDPGPGQVLVRNLFTSVDPGMRLRLRESGPAGYFNSFALNAAMDDIWAVGEVVESRAEGFEPGDTVWHAKGWRDYAIVTAGEPALAGIATLARLDTTVAPAEKYLGPLGAMGVTAYAGLIDAAELRDGDVVWVSAAAGAVGSLAAQIANLRGHRVIGSAGSEAKVRFLLDELGLDAAFNYHEAPCLICCDTPHPTASTCTSTTSAVTTSRQRSPRCETGEGPRCVGRSPTTSRSGRRVARATCSRPRRTI